MKKLLMMAAAMLTLAACVDEGVNWDEPAQSSDNVGYLSLGEGGVTVAVEQEEGASDAKPQSQASKQFETRAADLAAYTVQIFKSDGTKAVEDFTLGSISSLENYRDADYTNDGKHPAIGTAGLELPVGTYTVRVFSDVTPNVGTAPQYEGSTTVKLTKGVATTAEVMCTLSSVKVTVTFDSSMAEVIAPASTSIMARLDEEGVTEPSAYTWSGYADKAALTAAHADVTPTYLKPQAPTAEGSPMNLYLTTLYGDPASQINAQKLPVGNVKAGEWRKVTVKLDHGTDGSVYFVVDVETWVANNQIDVTQATYAATLAEAEIPDVTDAPVIETPEGGLDFAQALTLTEDMFNESGAYTGNASMTVKTKQPIKAFYLSATSDSEGLPELLTYLGLSATATEGGYAGLNLAGTLNAASKSILSTWGFPTANIANQTELTFNIAGLLAQLQTEEGYTGNHTFSMTVVDAKENNKTFTLQITSGIIETDIVWVDEDIDQRYDIYTGGGDPTTMKIKITAASGIKSLRVDISGDLANVVADVELSSSFDLVDPKDENGKDLSSALAGLGFPVGDKVKDKQSISFDITGFKELMGMASVSGHNDFKITLTENNDNVVEKTMMINVINEPYPGN